LRQLDPNWTAKNAFVTRCDRRLRTCGLRSCGAVARPLLKYLAKLLSFRSVLLLDDLTDGHLIRISFKEWLLTIPRRF
jgi:hypothetical protein